MATKPCMYMGTRYRADWVPAPATGGSFSEVGYNAKQQYLNGGAAVRRSRATHREYELAWNPTKRADLRQITDIASGLWGSGLIYFLDPMAIDQNLLPQFMAAPILAGTDGLPAVGEDAPTLSATPITSLGYPVQMGHYGTSTVRQRVYIPIPPGYSAWVGVHGDTSIVGGSLAVQPLLGPDNLAAEVVIPMQGVNDVVRVSTQFNGDDYQGIEVYVQDNTTYAGAMVQVFKNGINPPLGDFISGQGNSGCEFAETPQMTAYSAPLDRVGMTATLVEVGAWQ